MVAEWSENGAHFIIKATLYVWGFLASGKKSFVRISDAPNIMQIEGIYQNIDSIFKMTGDLSTLFEPPFLFNAVGFWTQF